MKLPFTSDQFLELFKGYNQAIFPFQVILYLIAAISLFFCISRKNKSDKVTNSILAFFWIWMGTVYHLGFFASINKAALLFGIAFIFQGILIIYSGIYKNRLKYKPTVKGLGLVSSFFIVFSLIIYPLLSILFGHIYPSSPTFGLPCPTTIFTFGILLWSDRKIPVSILIIPFLWSLIGFTAAIKLGITEDIALLIAALITVVIAVFQGGKQKIHPA